MKDVRTFLADKSPEALEIMAAIRKLAEMDKAAYFS
jgi:hypothetical protein